MISYTDALNIIRQTAGLHRLQSERVTLEKSVGRICFENLTVGLNIPPFDNAAMDGFAVRLSDISGANPEKPVILKNLGQIGAGDAGSYPLEAGTCWHIMTGAPVPANVDCIIPIENVTFGPSGTVTFSTSASPGQHIRRSGEDFKKGTNLPLAGQRITPAHVMALASIGMPMLSVFRKPRILFVSTGTEIIDDLGQLLSPGKIYNSNMPFARAFLDSCGADISIEKTIRDDTDAFLSILRNAEQSKFDIIVSSGAVSAGAHDFVKEGLNIAGAEILYHKIRLKPGKPNLFARLPRGALYFGLPGNPVATAVGLRFFVIEAVRAFYGQKPECPMYARAMNKFSKKAGLHFVLKGFSESWDDGILSIDILDGQESFMVSPFLKMNSWIHVHENIEAIKTGDALEIYPFMPF